MNNVSITVAISQTVYIQTLQAEVSHLLELTREIWLSEAFSGVLCE